MILQTLFLENFRNHAKRKFSFSPTTIIVGKNTTGKTNIAESIYFLSHAMSFRADKGINSIGFNYDYAKITGEFDDNGSNEELTVILSVNNSKFSKRFLVNKVPKLGVDFVSKLYTVLFTPTDIEIINGSPSLRRNNVDMVLYQASRDYRIASSIYDKALRHRNRMLYDLREGKKYYKFEDFRYWDQLLIENGQLISEQRQEFVDFVNDGKKEIFNFKMEYDKSLINESRLEKYYDAERAAGITLVGPQRDDFLFYYTGLPHSIREFGSRGEQRLTVLQLKIFEIQYLERVTHHTPMLLLDDIFSELDNSNIEKIFSYITFQQTVITTTHEEFVPKEIVKGKSVGIIEL